MRIVVNNIAASSGGALSILKSFYNYLIDSETEKENEWIFLLSGNYIKETKNIKVIVLDEIKKSWINRLKFDLFLGRKIITELKPDVVLSLQNTITFGLNINQVLYMHQSIPFQNVKKFSFFKSEERILAIYQFIIGVIIKESIKKADKIIVQTEWIKEAVIKSTNIKVDKIVKILPPNEDIVPYKKDNLFKSDNFFYPADNSVYKNHNCIYEACKLLNEKGVTNFKISLTIKGAGYSNNITQLGKIPFDLVMEKYNTSTLLYPSYIETIGLPLLEARSMGTIILAADLPFSREALDGYQNAYFFDPFNPNELAILMEKVITGQIRRINQNVSNNNIVNSWNYVVDIIEEISGEKNENIMVN